MTTDALTLAALASAALSGLRPIGAEAVRGQAGERFQVGFIEDAEHRRWVIRVPTDAVAAAQQDASVTLLGMLARRLPFGVPAPKGFAPLKDGRRAMLYPLISGHALSFYAMPAGPGLAAELGRAIAALHNVDRRLFEDAAVPVYDPEEVRRRRFVLLDRGAETGSVPVGLLSRWERMLDDVSVWRFAPTPVHGRLDGPHVLAAFSSPEDATSGRIRAIVGWEDAHVGDPSEDFAALLASAAPEAVDTVLEAYAMSRIEHPDAHLEQRARLVAELRLLEDLLGATVAKDRQAIAAAGQALRRLDAEVGDRDVARAPVRPDSAADVTVEPSGEEALYSAGRPAPAAPEWVTTHDDPDDVLYAAGSPRPPEVDRDSEPHLRSGDSSYDGLDEEDHLDDLVEPDDDAPEARPRTSGDATTEAPTVEQPSAEEPTVEEGPAEICTGPLPHRAAVEAEPPTEPVEAVSTQPLPQSGTAPDEAEAQSEPRESVPRPSAEDERPPGRESFAPPVAGPPAAAPQHPAPDDLAAAHPRPDGPIDGAARRRGHVVDFDDDAPDLLELSDAPQTGRHVTPRD